MKPLAPEPTLKEVLEGAIHEMVDKRIYWSEALNQFEKLFILEALRYSKGNLCRAAERIGVHRNTLSKKLREYQIDRKAFR